MKNNFLQVVSFGQARGVEHTAENGPSGFKSKHLNFFFGLCLYAGY